MSHQENLSEDKKKGQAEKTEEKVIFTCHRCNLSEECDYLGKRPPFCRKQVIFHEDAFVMKDPFSPKAEEGAAQSFLLLGGKCLTKDCSREEGVCMECSVYYKHRYCLDCASQHIRSFPTEVQAKISKKLAAAKKA